MPSDPPSRNSPPTRWWVWLELIALIAFAATRWVGYREHVDLHFSDEMIYLRQGQALLADGVWPEFAYAPIYSAWAGLVAAVTPPTVLATDALYAATSLLAVLAVWWSFRPLLPTPWPLLAGAWTATLSPILQTGASGAHALPNVYAAAGATMVLAIGAWIRQRWWSAALLGLCCCGIRGEACSWLLAAAALTAICVRPVPRRGVLLLAAAGAVGAAALLLAPSSSSRSWLAFKQHYARHAVLERLLAARPGDQSITPEAALAGLAAMSNAFTFPDPVVAEDFPGATSPLGALWRDPRRFAAFVEKNLQPVPAAVVELVIPGSGGQSWAPMLAILLVALAAAGWWALWRWRRERFGRHWSALPIGCTGVMALAAVAWTGPRIELLLPFAWTWIAVLGGLLAWSPTGRRGLVWCAGAGLLALGTATVALPGPFRTPSPRVPTLREGVQVVHQLALSPTDKLLCSASDCYSVLGGIPLANCVQLDQMHGAKADFAGALLRARVNHVLLDGLLTPALAAMPHAMAHLQSDQWRLLSQHGGASCYVRR